jgi:hypothetical protein
VEGTTLVNSVVVDEPELSHNGFLNGWVAAGSHNGDLGEGGEKLRVTQKTHLGKGEGEEGSLRECDSYRKLTY